MPATVSVISKEATTLAPAVVDSTLTLALLTLAVTLLAPVAVVLAGLGAAKAATGIAKARARTLSAAMNLFFMLGTPQLAAYGFQVLSSIALFCKLRPKSST